MNIQLIIQIVEQHMEQSGPLHKITLLDLLQILQEYEAELQAEADRQNDADQLSFF